MAHEWFLVRILGGFERSIWVRPGAMLDAVAKVQKELGGKAAAVRPMRPIYMNAGHGIIPAGPWIAL